VLKILRIDKRRCIGCMACALICKQVKSHKGLELIYVEEVSRGEWAPTVCMHCQQAPCVNVCPAEAIVKLPDGVVKRAEEARCLACRNCYLICPFGAPKIDERSKLMVKCDLCPERRAKGLLPYCATICPTGAIRYEESVEASIERREEAAQRLLRARPLT
jgi:Fe-S-cluster-containing dehydrogenase component